MDQKQYLDLKDMIDGGGAGQMGDTFQGGGLLSILANAFAKPYGSEDPVRKRERMKVFGLLGDDMPKPVQVQPVMRTRQQPVPTYGADAGIAATNRAMNMPYNQTQAMPGYNMPAPNPVAEMPNSVPLRDPGGDYDRAGLITNYLFTRDNNPELLPRWLDRVVELYGIDALRELQASVTPNMSYEGKQIVPTMTQPSVPEIARMASTNPRFSPVFAQDYGDYLEYMNTGRYPRGERP